MNKQITFQSLKIIWPQTEKSSVKFRKSIYEFNLGISKNVSFMKRKL